jgi:hypothetical protein
MTGILWIVSLRFFGFRPPILEILGKNADSGPQEGAAIPNMG